MSRRYHPVVGPRLTVLLDGVFALFALLVVNAFYLLAIRGLEAATGETYQNWFYMIMFLAHLVLGVILIVPFIVFAVTHARRAHNRPNRRAVKMGYALLVSATLLLISGLVLTRLEGLIVVKDPTIRSTAYWIHVITPLVAAWLFVLHRLAGRKILWQRGRRWAAVAVGLAALLALLQSQDPRAWNVEGPTSGEQYFFPSLARTSTGDFIPAEVLDNNAYCERCHSDTHERWENSVHHISSFNNPPYAFSVRETRKVALARDGNVQASRFCAGCHDPVVFFSGRFDDPDFNDMTDPTAHAGITCTVCHSITHINSPRGNADYTIEEPEHYPFAFSDSGVLRFVNEQLVKAKPGLHKKTFLKPHHETAEFCATCHKVHLPEELNQYKFLRGQNHYDSFLLSGVSGHGVASFYYPETAETSCNGCHMEALESSDFGAREIDDSGVLQVHDHLFPSANTAIAHLLDLPDWVQDAHVAFNEDVMRVDLFGVKANGNLDGELTAPLRPEVPVLRPGEPYLFEIVVRTLGLGHHFTQGTADSNQIWLDVTVSQDGQTIGRSGGVDEVGRVDPWSHFINSYVLDREGNRIDRRNAEDIFVPLYNHQIPPGAADVIHYAIDIPEDLEGPVRVDVALRYRKFDTTYMRYVYGPDYVNDLPVMTLATDSLEFPVAGAEAQELQRQSEVDIPEWQRWNDYGIGLLRKGGKSKGELRQAEIAFQRVESLGRPDGPLNLARVYLAQGTVEDRAIDALERASNFDPPAPAWSVAWFTGLVNKQNGFLDEAIVSFESLIEGDDRETRRRGFDFSYDYRLLNELGQTLFERSKVERGPARAEQRAALLARATAQFERALEIDPENVTAHYNLSLIHRQLENAALAEENFALYLKYKPDDNARDLAIARHRSENPAANHAAEAIVIYDLQRDGAPTGVVDAIGPATHTRMTTGSQTASTTSPTPVGSNTGAAP